MTKEIPLTQGMFAIVDDCDFEWLSQRRYHYSAGTGYAQRGGGRTSTGMHRDIVECPTGMQVDHINGNRLDNRRENLRIVTSSQNNMNRTCLGNSKTSRYRGVSVDINRGKWQVTIMKSANTFYLGRYDDEVEAAIAHDTACRILFGSYGRPNFNDSDYRELRGTYSTTVAKVEKIVLSRTTEELRD